MPITPTHSVWRGTQDIKLQPTYPRFRRTARGAVLTLVYRGPYADLRTYGPDIGDSVDLVDFGYAASAELVYAASVECQPDGAGLDGAGTLTVVYSNEADSGGVLIANQTTVEVDYSALEKPLITHPRYATGGAKALTDDDRGKIEAWRAAPDATTYGALSANAQDYVDKIKKGIESYIVGAPLARKTTRDTVPAAVNSVGQRSTSAPVSGAPSGYEWLKTADRAIRQAPASGWERVEEWTAAKAWDADLYTGVI